ncbi:MAG: class I SAM-dependent methyltransferase, partial [Sandaracinaceae bacterium]|nr:class I SAM-dependent methyltransferase [Sandaracinaceae bacterium]
LYREPAYYRMLFDGRSADLPFYLQHAKSEILEIGVGAGRVAIALAREGHRVHGVDLAPDMLSALETRLAEEPPELASRISFRQADARTVRLDRTFARVFIPFNGIAHYPSASDLGALLGTVRAHLAPGGLFVFDAMLPRPDAAGRGRLEHTELHAPAHRRDLSGRGDLPLRRDDADLDDHDVDPRAPA